MLWKNQVLIINHVGAGIQSRKIKSDSLFCVDTWLKDSLACTLNELPAQEQWWREGPVEKNKMRKS